MVTLSFTIFSGQKNYNRAHMLFQVLCGLEPIFYTTHPNEEPKIYSILDLYSEDGLSEKKKILILKFLLDKIKMMNYIYFGEEE